MASPLVNRLIEDIRSSGDTVKKACLKADLACYYSRVGDFYLAEKLKEEVRKDFGKGESLPVSVRLLCLDALLLFFRDSSPLSRDRMLRAKLLSTAAGDSSLIALTSSWLAQLDFNFNHMESMWKNIDETLSSIGIDDAPAECRVAVVLAGLMLLYGEDISARYWHARSRDLSVRLGDQAAMGALLYNRAVYRTMLARISLDARRPVDLNELEVDIQNAVNYQAVAQVHSLTHWLQILESSFLMLTEQYQFAIVQIRRILDEGTLPKSSSQYMILEADYALASARCGCTTEAAECANLFRPDSLASHLSIEERIIVLGTWEAVAELCGLTEQSLALASQKNLESASRVIFRNEIKKNLKRWKSVP